MHRISKVDVYPGTFVYFLNFGSSFFKNSKLVLKVKVSSEKEIATKILKSKEVSGYAAIGLTLASECLCITTVGS